MTTAEGSPARSLPRWRIVVRLAGIIVNVILVATVVPAVLIALSGKASMAGAFTLVFYLWSEAIIAVWKWVAGNAIVISVILFAYLTIRSINNVITRGFNELMEVLHDIRAELRRLNGRQ